MRILTTILLAGGLTTAATPSLAYQSPAVPEQVSGSAINLICTTNLHARLRLDIMEQVIMVGGTPRGFDTADVSYLIRFLRLDSDRWKDLAQRIELRLKQGEARCMASH